MIGKEAKVMLNKWQKPYSKVCGYVNAQMSIIIV
jgi:hypothetical protein